MEKKLGTTLQVGVTARVSELGGLEQTGGHSAAGELKTFYDKDGTAISVYLVDGHTEYRWTALLPANLADKELGDTISIDGVTDTCYVTQWEVTETNDDAKRVNIAARSTEISTSSGTGN